MTEAELIELQELEEMAKLEAELGGQSPQPRQAAPREVSSLEAFLRGTGQGVLPGTEANVAAQRASAELGQIGAGRPELMSPSEEAAMLSSPELAGAQKLGEQERAQFGVPGIAGQVVGSAIGMPAQMASKAASAIPAAASTAPRVLKMASDVAKGAIAAPAASATMSLGEGEVPSASDIAASSAIGGAVPGVAHLGGMAKDTLANFLRGGAQKAAGFTDEMATTWAHDKALVKQLAHEKMHDPTALENRAKRLSENAIKAAQEKSKAVSQKRGELMAPLRMRVDPAQFKNTAVQGEAERLAAAMPTTVKRSVLAPEENMGLMLKEVAESVPAEKISMSGAAANRLKGELQDAIKYRQVYQQIGEADKTASIANKQAERSLRKALEGASKARTGKDTLRELNLGWGKQLADERTIKRAAQTNPSMLITSPTVKTQAVAQRMSPELRRAQEAYQTSKAILPEAGLVDELSKASGRLGISLLGPKTARQDYTQLQNLPSIVAAIEAMNAPKKRER